MDIQTRDARKSGDPAMEMAAGKQMGEAIKAAMQNTIQFLGGASAADTDAVAGVLHFFASGGQPDGPAPPGTEALGMAQQMLHDAEMMIQGHPPAGDPNMPPPPGDPNMMPPSPGDPNMKPPMGDAPPMSPEGALLVEPGMFPNVAPECNDELRNSELTPQGTHEQDGMTGSLLFRTVCNSPSWENNAITLPAGRNASHFGVEAATTGKIYFGISVECGAPVWTTADGKAAYDALHLTSAAPSANGKYTIFIDPAKSDPGVRVTISFVDHQ